MKITESYFSDTTLPIEVIEARYLGDFVVRIHFNDGVEKAVDFKSFLKNSRHPAIQKYLDEALFKTFSIKDGNLDWNDFELCFPIHDLYNNNILKENSRSILTQES